MNLPEAEGDRKTSPLTFYFIGKVYTVWFLPSNKAKNVQVAQFSFWSQDFCTTK